MADSHNRDVEMEEDYHESEDSDFHADNGDDERISSSSEEDVERDNTNTRPAKRRKIAKPAKKEVLIEELDSGDEATIREQEKIRKKQRKNGDEDLEDGNDEEQEWRARTRAMREKDKEEKKHAKLASARGSTIDVDKIWEEMNRPGGLQDDRPRIEVIDEAENADTGQNQSVASKPDDIGQENLAPVESEDLITIKVPYRFAGEIHFREKTVSRSSAEAQRYLSKHSTNDIDGEPLRRPLRKISRFDPNLNSLDAYKLNLVKTTSNMEPLTGPKLNTVEKSKIDWTSHVEKEGLKEELNVAAKAKGGYIANQQFLDQIDQRREEEARYARLRS